MFNIRSAILIDYQQIVNKVPKGFRVMLRQLFSLILQHRCKSFTNMLLIGLFLCQEKVQSNTERPDINRRMSIFPNYLFDWCIKGWHHLFYCSQRFSLRVERCPEISYYEDFLVSNGLLENIIGLDITMYDLLLVNEIQRDADHCKNSKYAVFWQKSFFIVFDNVFKTLITLFHYNA